MELKFSDLKKVHIVGVCGTLMGAFACFLKRSQISVSGSDQNIYPPMSEVLQAAGIELFNGYKKENFDSIKSGLSLAVIGNVIRKDNREAACIMESNVPYVSLPEFMEKMLLPHTHNIVVSGTHGKTTTSSLMAHVLQQSDKNPSYFIGGVSQDFPHSFHVSETNKYFVLEGDEYDTAFWDKVPKFNHYLPRDVVLTSVEYDHADIYPSFESVIKAFEGLVSRIHPQGRLIACTDYPVMKRLIEQSSVEVHTYGSHEVSGAQYTPKNIQTSLNSTSFDIFYKGEKQASVTTPLSGMYNVLNVLAVWIEARLLGISESQIKSALASFKGVKRRQEVKLKIDNLILMDDFAHHPTAVRETLQGLKARFPDHRLVCVFEPRSATSRRKIFQSEYIEALSNADVIYVAEPFDQSKTDATERFSAQEVVEALQAKNKVASRLAPVKEAAMTISNNATNHDLIAVLSNGGFDGLLGYLGEELKLRFSK